MRGTSREYKGYKIDKISVYWGCFCYVIRDKSELKDKKFNKLKEAKAFIDELVVAEEEKKQEVETGKEKTKTVEKIERHDFSLDACYKSVVTEVEIYKINVYEALGKAIIRAEQDPFYNKRMIDAYKKYIKEHQ